MIRDYLREIIPELTTSDYAKERLAKAARSDPNAFCQIRKFAAENNLQDLPEAH